MEDAFLVTERLYLRPHRPDDVPFMMRLNADPEVIRYTGEGALESTEQAEAIIEALQKQFQSRQLGRLVVCERQTGEPLGWCGLKWYEEEGGVDLGYRFLRSAWGKGYATEASKACLRWAATQKGLDYIFAHAFEANIASCRVLEKVGFQRSGKADEQGILRFEQIK